VPPPQKAKPVRLPSHISGASAFRLIVGSCLNHFIQNQPAAIAGIDDEGIHQARVAIRRLRSALVLFEDYAGATAALAFREALRDAARILGEARDWDVFLAETIPAYLAARPDASVASFRLSVIRLRAAAHRRVRRALAEPRHQRLVVEIEGWIKGDSWRSGLGLHAFRSLEDQCRNLAPPLLDRAQRRVRKRGRAIAEQLPEERHELRKAMKKLRYSAEFLAALYPPKAVRRYLLAVERVQDVLGRLNDAAGIVSLLERLPPPRDGNLAERDAVRAWAEAGSAHDLSELEDAWRQFEAAKPFWP